MDKNELPKERPSNGRIPVKKSPKEIARTNRSSGGYKPSRSTPAIFKDKSAVIGVIAALVIVVLIVSGGLYWLFNNNSPNNGGGNSGGGNGGGNEILQPTIPPTDPKDGSGGEIHEPIVSGDLSVHFLELGNKYTGDSVYIKSGDTDILIDAGSKYASASTIHNYLSKYVTDNKLEYVIATHAHEDHIAGFGSASQNNYKGIFALYETGIIIDFPRTDSTTVVLNNYIAARDLEIEQGAKHYTALECYNNENGAARTYSIGDGIELEILYNYYYDHKSSGENDYSVCVMIHQGEYHYLFTGDLEKAGEDRLVDFYNGVENPLLPHCVLYKAGHHGSSTSSNEKLLAAITPEHIAICTCAGSTEYTTTVSNTFPTQIMIDRIALYTDKVYVTTLMIDYSQSNYTSMNGNIVFTVISGVIEVHCSNNNLILKETAWFKANRIMPDKWK